LVQNAASVNFPPETVWQSGQISTINRNIDDTTQYNPI